MTYFRFLANLLRTPSIIIVAIASVLFAVNIASASVSNTYSSPAVEATLVTAVDGIAPGSKTFSAGLHLKLGEGWKTYWRSPGEVGFPPEIDWSKSRNIANVEILWPAPERFTAFGIENFGYQDEVLFPLQVSLNQEGPPIEFLVDVKLLVCSKICVPEEFTLQVPLAIDITRDEISSAQIAEYLAKVPSEGNLTYANAFISRNQTELVFEAHSEVPFAAPDLFPELGVGTALGKPDIRLSGDGTRLWAALPILSVDSDNYQMPIVTLTDGPHRALTVSPEIVNDAPTPPYALAQNLPALNELVWIAVVAILGGLILNAMPCVLPVLSIKVSSVLKAEGRSKAQIRIGFLFSALGVMVFMWTLAAVLFALKFIGYNVGWGLQFQNPAFVFAMFVVLSLFAGNLFGLFDIRLPAPLSRRLAVNGSGQGYAADFFTGLFGAILATPCSAPFLGTAIAFALAGRGLDILVVFTALGLGLSLPYLIFAAFPNMVALLPKPGRWMALLKSVMGILLTGTAVWLLYVLLGLSGVHMATLAFSGTALILIFVTRNWLRTAAFASIVLILGISGMPLVQKAEQRSEKIAWTQFERGEIAQQISQGNTVFVDVTADWCLTCKANKALILERDPVLSHLNSSDVVAMQADWTQPDKRIGDFLESHGRFAIPFNAVFGPSAPDGIVLPEILSVDGVLDAMKQAGLAEN